MLIFNIFISILLILMTLVIHEMGHWIALSKLKVSISEFGFGFGPKLFQIKSFCFRLFPIGAYLAPDPSQFKHLPDSSKFQVAIAGPLASLVNGIALLVACSVLDPLSNSKGLQLLGELNVAFALFNILPIPPFDGWMALNALAGYFKHPFSPFTCDIANRLGNGLVWGIGFFVVFKLLVIL